MQSKTLKILLVEDNPGDARLMGEMLLERGSDAFEVTHAERLGDAAQALGEGVFDAVLLDLSLPDSSGMATIDGTKSNDANKYTPIIVVTGRYSEADAVESVSHGAQDFLEKNDLRGETLVRSIRVAVAREHLRQEEEAAKMQRRQTAEIASLEQMSAPLASVVTARPFARERLSESAPDTFEVLVDQYCELIGAASKGGRFHIDERTSQGIRVLAQRLGFLRAGPEDVVELHVTSVKRLHPEEAAASYAVVEEARTLLVDLMGNLAGYYRDHMMPRSPVISVASSVSRTE